MNLVYHDLLCTSLEYYGECFCGDSVAGAQIAESNCNFPCTGNQSEACGGNDILSVYQDPTFHVDNTSTISDYQALGCWTDSSPSGRTLVYMQNNLHPASMTVEECLFACKDSGYPFAGVEYAVSEKDILIFLQPQIQKLTGYRVNAFVELFLEMVPSRSTAACATCHATAIQARPVEDPPF